jgi:hypothetical protein
MGFRKEVTDGTAIIFDNSSLKPLRFAYYDKSWGNFPKYIQDIVRDYFGDSYDPYAMRVVKESSIAEHIGAATNSLLWYLALGSVVNSGSADPEGTHTISGIDTGEIPSFTTRWLSSDTDAVDQSAAKYFNLDSAGCKMVSIGFSLSMRGQNQTLYDIYSFILRIPPADAGTTRHEPVYAEVDSGASSNNVPYTKDSLCVLTWDTGGTPIDITKNIISITHRTNLGVTEQDKDGQKYAGRSLSGDRTTVVSFQMHRRDVIALWTHFLAQPAANDFKNMTFRIHAGSNRYRLYTYTGCAIGQMDPNHAFDKKAEKPIWSLEIHVKSFTLETVDGLNDSYYG